MTNVEAEIRERLKQMDIVPLIGGLIPEKATAVLLGYAPAYMRQQAARGLSLLPYVQRGNRRFYRIADIETFVTEAA